MLRFARDARSACRGSTLLRRRVRAKIALAHDDEIRRLPVVALEGGSDDGLLVFGECEEPALRPGIDVECGLKRFGEHEALNLVSSAPKAEKNTLHVLAHSRALNHGGKDRRVATEQRRTVATAYFAGSSVRLSTGPPARAEPGKIERDPGESRAHPAKSRQRAAPTPRGKLAQIP